MKKNQLKRISFISIVIMIITTSVGAGIFMKNNEILRDSHYNLILAIFAWIIAGIGCLAMGVALIELTSATFKNNRGILGWTQKFTNPFVSDSASNFVAYVSMPFVKFLLPIYFMQEMQNAFHWNVSWWAIFLIGIAITLWFNLLSGLYTNCGMVQNWIFMFLKIIPIIVVIIWGFASVDPSIIHTDIRTPEDIWKTSPTIAFTPVFGLIAAIPAVYFAIDGFYSGISMTSEMKHPEKAPLAVVIGIFAIIFLYIIISCAILVSSSTGTIQQITSLNKVFHGTILIVLNVLIGVGILGIENSYAMMSPRLYEELIKNDELPFSSWLKTKINPNRPILGVFVSLIILVPYFIIFTLIGTFAFYNMGNYSADYMQFNVCTLYSFTDLIGNWSSFFIFVWITIAIIGCMLNRKTNKVVVKQNKYFLPAAYITVILNCIALLFVFVSTFVDFGIFLSNTSYYSENGMPNWIGGLLKIVMLAIMFVLSFGITGITRLVNRKKIKKSSY